MKPLVVVAGSIHADGIKQLEAEARVIVTNEETEAGFLKVAQEASGVLFRAKPRCTRSLMAACILHHQHHLAARRGDRLCEPDPLRIGASLLVAELSAERVRRLGQRAEPKLSKERPLTPLELADMHPWPSAGLLGRHEDDTRGFENEGPTIKTAEELDVRPALRRQQTQELVGGVEADLGLAQQAVLVLEPPFLLDPARAHVEAVLDAHRAFRQLHRPSGRHAEAAWRIEDAASGPRPDGAEDPADLRLGVGLGLETPRDGGPRLLEKFDVEHGSHYTESGV